MGTLLVACPSCSCHAFAREIRCPSCGALLRASDGSIQRTAGAVLLGLSITVTTAACGSDVSSGGGGGHGGMSSTSSMGGFQTVSAYGIGPSVGPSTTSSSSGGGAGGGDAGGGDAGTD